MKVMILTGGLGTRISDESRLRLKPINRGTADTAVYLVLLMLTAFREFLKVLDSIVNQARIVV
jgi:hypothetical protein